MASLFQPEIRDTVFDRVSRLDPGSKALWGRFTAPEMVCHVSCHLRQGLGELATATPHHAAFPCVGGVRPGDTTTAWSARPL